MADATIAGLQSGSPAQSTDVIPIQRGASTFNLTVSDIAGAVVVPPAVLSIGTAGVASPTPAYVSSESPLTINPALYVQDINGQWHMQAGMDTTALSSGFPGSGPSGPAGTLTWTRRQFYRSDQNANQSFKNSFMSIAHAAGCGTTQTNQDRALGMNMTNATAVILDCTIASNVITFLVTAAPLNFGIGQVFTPTGLTTFSQLNFGQFKVTGVTSQPSSPNNTVITVPMPFPVSSVQNAAAGTTVYVGYFNRATNLAGQTFVVAGFTNAANNGTFTCSASTANTITLSNSSGIAETPAITATATQTFVDHIQAGDSGNLDQHMYSMAVIQAELDVVGAPSWDSAVDGEASVFSGQISLVNPTNITTPALGYNILRANVFKSGAGQLGGNTPVTAVVAGVIINNTAANGGAQFTAVGAQVRDLVGGAVGTTGIAVNVSFSNRCAQSNYGLKTGDYSQAYTVTSVNNASAGATVYNGSFSVLNGLVGQNFKVTGLANAANNGTFLCSGNTAGTITLVNPSGVAETKTVVIQSLADYAIYSAGGQVYLNGNISRYMGRDTVGNGIPSEVNQIVAASLTANYNAGNAKTIFTPTAPSQLRISYSQALTIVATTTSTFPSLTLGWTDVGGVARTKMLVSADSTNTTAVESDGVVVLTTDGSTVVTVTSAGYASNTAAQMAYALTVTTEVL